MRCLKGDFGGKSAHTAERNTRPLWEATQYLTVKDEGNAAIDPTRKRWQLFIVTRSSIAPTHRFCWMKRRACASWAMSILRKGIGTTKRG